MTMYDALCFIGSAWAAEVADAAAATVGDAWNQILTAAMVAIVPIIGTIGTYAVILVRSWLKAKIAKIKNDELRAAADFAMLRLDRIVTNVVKEIQQTKPTSGALTEEQSKKLLTIAYNRVKAQVTDDILETIKTVVKDPDRYTVTKIEAAVGEQKIAKTTAECK
jgi:hypothetical protein